jgi:hypothetical protein
MTVRALAADAVAATAPNGMASVANRAHWRKKQQEGKKGEVVAGTVQNVGGWPSRDVRGTLVPNISGSIGQGVDHE